MCIHVSIVCGVGILAFHSRSLNWKSHASRCIWCHVAGIWAPRLCVTCSFTWVSQLKGECVLCCHLAIRFGFRRPNKEPGVYLCSTCRQYGDRDVSTKNHVYVCHLVAFVQIWKSQTSLICMNLFHMYVHMDYSTTSHSSENAMAPFHTCVL